MDWFWNRFSPIGSKRWQHLVRSALREKPKWKKLSRKDGSKNRHVAWAQLLWRTFGVMGFVCTHCKRMMRLRAVAIYPPATTKILDGGITLIWSEI
jgi:hypothetical protein